MNRSRENIIAELPSPTGNSVFIEDNQTVSDIMSLILYMHKKNRAYYDRICSDFWAGSILSTCKDLFTFCKKNIPYSVESEDLQTVKSPQRILTDAEIGLGHDCKHYASFIGGVLDALRRQGKSINWVYRFASYRIFDNIPGHVFVVVKTSGGEIWIDPVLDSFNEKKRPTYSVDKSVSSAIGYIGGKAIGADNKTAVDIQVVGGTVIAVAGAVAAVVPVGTVVAAVLVVAGVAVQLIAKLFQGKYTYSTQVRWLIQNYQYRVLGQCGVTSDNKVNESYANATWLWFSVCLGIPIWDNLRIHALRGTDPNTDKSLNWTRDQKIQAYYNFGSLEKQSPASAVGNAVDIAVTFDDYDTCGGWKNFYPANIVLTNGLSTDQAATQAAPLLAASTEGQIQAAQSATPGLSTIIPSNNPFSNLISSIPTPVLFIAVGGLLYLLTEN